jgi:hypothetical protein
MITVRALRRAAENHTTRQFLHSALLVTIVLPVLALMSVRTPAQTAGSKNDAKVGVSVFEGEIMDGDCAQMGSHDATMKAVTLGAPDLCTAYCLRFKKTPGKYVLYNATTKMIYQLDKQQEASFFGARKVKVTGTYDEATKTIHVSDITFVSTS